MRDDPPKLCLAGQLRFRQHTHVDQIAAPLAIHDALCPRRELRALHAHNTLVRKQLYAPSFHLQRLLYMPLQPFHQLAAEWVPKRRMGYDRRTLEKRGRTYSFCTIDDLRGENEGAWGDLFAQGSDCGEGDDGTDAERFEGCDVGARGDRGGGDGVPLTVPCKECDSGAGWKGRDCDWGAGKAPWLDADKDDKDLETARDLLFRGLHASLGFTHNR
jgi:hypothetical protein